MFKKLLKKIFSFGRELITDLDKGEHIHIGLGETHKVSHPPPFNYKKLIEMKEDFIKIVERPWGSYEILEQEKGYWIKRIEVKPGERLSLQYHCLRREEWIIVQGGGIVILDDEIINIGYGSQIHIDVFKKHRIENTGTKPLVFIEVAFGDKLTEDDIVRVEDDYGR